MAVDRAEGVADYRFLTPLDAAQPDLFVACPPARLALSSERVLVKIIKGVTGERSLKRAADELRTFAHVNSRFLASLYDAGQDGECVFYVMEYPALGTLASPMRRLDDDERLLAVACAARGAHDLHEAGLAHRNITPSSILLHEGSATLANLGMAKALEPEGSVSRFPVVADIEYMDPAILLGGTASRATDVWSLGVVLHWTMSGGAPLHPGRSEVDAFGAVRQVMSEPPVISPTLRRDVAAVVHDALAPDPADRPATADALATRIEALAGRS